jgi:hypothetical protein
MNELWLTEAAQTFWDSAGGYSHDFEFAAVIALPLSVERLTNLSLVTAYEWLASRSFKLNGLKRTPDRALRGCLVALGEPCNFILLDANDPPAEQSFSLAHEVAHYLLDYLGPRRKAEQTLDTSILEVLDGLRPPSLEERLQGVLVNFPLQPYRHFMERNSAGDILSSEVLQAEARADQLALELLAPLEQALPIVKAAIKARPTYSDRLEATRVVLSGEFNLPVAVTRPYATRLVKLAGGEPTFGEWLQF